MASKRDERAPEPAPDDSSGGAESARKPFLLRIDAEVLKALERWSADELRSVNAQIEFLLREALRRAGRSKEADPRPARK